MDAISTLTTGIEAILRERFPADRWTIEHVPTPMTLKEFERVVRATPWIGISWRQNDADNNQGRSTPVTIRARVVVVVKNPSVNGRLLGDVAGPGLYGSAELARLTLHTREIADIGTIYVTQSGQAYSDGHGDLAIAIAVMEIEATPRTVRTIAEGEEPPDFAALVTSWDFAPGAGSPAEDVTDTIETGDPT